MSGQKEQLSILASHNTQPLYLIISGIRHEKQILPVHETEISFWLGHDSVVQSRVQTDKKQLRNTDMSSTQTDKHSLII